MRYNLRNKIKDSFIVEDDDGEEDEEDFDEDMTTLFENPKLCKLSSYKKIHQNLVKTTIKKSLRKTYRQKLLKIRKRCLKNMVKIQTIVDAKIPINIKAKLLNDYEYLIRIEYFNPLFYEINNKIKSTITLYEKINKTYSSDHEALLEEIIHAEISEPNREKLFKKYHTLIQLESDTIEYANTKSYILYGMKITNTSIETLEKMDLSLDIANKMKQSLDALIYGQQVAKDEIIGTVINRMVDVHQGNITVLEGSPGTGKTYLARNIAELLGYKFYHISLGGQTSSDKILGSLSVYTSSKPGEIYNAIAEMGCNNGVILLDEFDKISPDKKDIYNSFLNILDPTQNKEFKDNYLYDLNIDLSNIWFIISVNDLSLVDPIVRDRLKNVIHFKNYTNKERKEILIQFFIPEMKNKYKLDFDVVFDEDVISYITQKENNGVRNMKMEIENIYKRIHLLHMTKNSEYKPLYFIEDYTHISLVKLKILTKNDSNDTNEAPFGMYT